MMHLAVVAFVATTMMQVKVPLAVCDDKASCGGFLGKSCDSKSHVCIDDPSDDCDPLNGGADCIGCCVIDQCLAVKCDAGLTCQLNSMGQAECVKDHIEDKDETSALAAVCKDKAACGGILGESCDSRSHVCIDDPSDDCNPLKGGADCSGCCVFDQCLFTKCSAGFTCQLNAMGQAECVKDKGPECCLAVPSCPKGYSQSKSCSKSDFVTGVCLEISLCCNTIICRSDAS
ncbi:hypothetical protein DIPPA_24865 [Diplonema papillatum]|nr:hypothetical protein DIPPA_24865 [Diplonema papillatum]